MSSHVSYYDNAATTLYKPDESIEEYKKSIKLISNPYSGATSLSMRTKRKIEECNDKLNAFFNCDQKENIIYYQSGSDSINSLLTSLIKDGDHIITTQMEHNSVYNVIENIKKDKKIEVSYLRIGHNGEVDLDVFKQMFKENTAIVFMNYASSLTGTVIPVKDISQIVKKNNCIFALDASQVSGIIPVDMQECNIDVIVSSCHKHLYSMPGLGVLLHSKNVELESIKNIRQVSMPNIMAIASLCGGINYINNKGIYSINKYMRDMSQYLVLKLKEIEELQVIHAGHSVPVISLKFKNIENSQICNLLDDKFNIITSSGLHNCREAHKNFGTFPEGTLRISLCSMNNVDEINNLIGAIKKILINK